MPVLKLTQDTPLRIELYSKWHINHGADAKSVFFSLFRGDTFDGHATMTPDEARTLGKMLIDEANHIERVGKSEDTNGQSA